MQVNLLKVLVPATTVAPRGADLAAAIAALVIRTSTGLWRALGAAVPPASAVLHRHAAPEHFKSWK